MRRAQELSEQGIEFIDIGISGGVWGLVHGFCLMVGGSDAAVKRMESGLPLPDSHRGCWILPFRPQRSRPLRQDGAQRRRVRPDAVLRRRDLSCLAAKEEFDLDLSAVAETWLHGSVVRSWLLELTAAALREDPVTGELASLRRGFWRGTLDRAGVRGSGGSHTGHLGGVAATFPFPPGRPSRRKAAGSPPPAVRRPRRPPEWRIGWSPIVPSPRGRVIQNSFSLIKRVTWNSLSFGERVGVRA